MSDWTAGYVADIGYTFGYYQELNPLRIKLAFLNAGLAFPKVGYACELGFGQGVSININAAASVTEWHGTDFNPSQAGFARELADASGANIHVSDEAFEEFCARDDLPDFDSIGLHGIWSWISDRNREVVVEFIRRKLKVGGVLYISYNTMPSWAPIVPVRHLLTEHSEVMGASGVGTVPRIEAALAFVERLFATGTAYGAANPSVLKRFDQIKGQNRNYLAHEYFNRDWLPMPISKMAEWLTTAKLSYACSADYLDHVDAINLNQEQQMLLSELPDGTFRQSVRDMIVDKNFRKDFWVRGGRKLTPLEISEQLRALRVVLTVRRAGIELKVRGSLGEATLSPAVYDPILDVLADHKPKSLGEIERAVAPMGVVFQQVIQAVLILAGSSKLQTAQDEAVVARARKQTDKLNHHLCMMARSAGDVSYLASPVTGGGVTVPRFSQIFLLARANGRKTPSEWAEYASALLTMQGQRMRKDGVTLDSDDVQLREMRVHADEFAENELPILKALGITS